MSGTPAPEAAGVLAFPGRLRVGASGRGADERAFLPAALEIIETPASPAGRAIALTISAATVLAIVWASFGQVDIIATAPGQVVSVGRSKTVQPLETGVVRAIDVADGDHVTAGQVLIELDPTQPGADQGRLAHDLLQAQLDRARLLGLRAALISGAAPALIETPAEAPAIELETATASMRAQAAEQAAKLAGLDQQIAQKQGEADEAVAAIAKLQASLPWMEQQAQIRRDAKNIEFGNKLAWMETEQRLVEMHHDLAIAVVKQRESTAARGTLERQRAQAAAEFEKNVLVDLAKSEQQANQAAHDLSKADQLLTMRTLRAPIDGVVQQLAVHTVGGVVTPAQALLVVAPDNPGLIVEAQVDNADVGFIHPGQPVEIKVETFTFTRYGLLHGQIVDVSRDSVSDAPAQQQRSQANMVDDEKAGITKKAKTPGYVAHVALDQNTLLVEGREERLAPGMAVTAEIKTGKRSVISFLLSPLRRYASEGMRER